MNHIENYLHPDQPISWTMFEQVGDEIFWLGTTTSSLNKIIKNWPGQEFGFTRIRPHRRTAEPGLLAVTIYSRKAVKPSMYYVPNWRFPKPEANVDAAVV